MGWSAHNSDPVGPGSIGDGLDVQNGDVDQGQFDAAVDAAESIAATLGAERVRVSVSGDDRGVQVTIHDAAGEMTAVELEAFKEDSRKAAEEQLAQAQSENGGGS